MVGKFVGRLVVGGILTLWLLPQGAWGKPPRNAESVLEKGKEAHDKACEEVEKSVHKAFDRFEKDARKDGRRDDLARVDEWRQQYADDQSIPSQFGNLRTRLWKAHADLATAYQDAIKLAIQKSDDDKAEEWQEELDDFLAKHDPFQHYSIWKGTVKVFNSDRKVKPYEGLVTCKILNRSQQKIKIEVNHSHERQWHIEFEQENNQWRATKLVLTKVQNHFGDPLGPRDIFANQVKFDGSTWHIEVVRKENQNQVRMVYDVQQE